MDHDTPHKNESCRVVRRFFTEQDAGNLAVIDELTSDDFQLHAAGVPGPLDRNGLRGFAEAFYRAFPDLHHTFLHQVASGGTVASHVRMRGTHRGEFHGIPATGADIDLTAMQFTRVEQGKLIEHWTVIDQLSLLGQLGAPGGAPEVPPNRTLFANMYEAFTAGDMERLATHFDPDIVWHTAGSNQLSGTYRGRADTIASFEREFDLSAGTYRPVVRDVLTSDTRIVALLHADAQRGDRALSEEYAIVFAVDRGLVVEAWECWWDQRAVNEFWS
ncbi:hypothetical protein GCM10009789_36460 [Kribbella sancticallisti]|uniref:SnoaL-like domain-containing protein n=1 Tax=Kribbella sancticallisti TaxID=460087 RepID=A0ABP4PFT8_9ACTN